MRRQKEFLRTMRCVTWSICLVLLAVIGQGAVVAGGCFALACGAGFSASAAAAERSRVVPEEERGRIEAAVPKQAPVRPKKRRRLLIFDRNVGYPGHRSIAHGNLAFTLMGRQTGAFETVVAHEPSVFQTQRLGAFDAVLFNNTVGNLFEDPQLRQNLVDFVYRGGGMMGLHGTTVAFTRWPGAREDWPEFGIMLGARGASHRASDERVFVKLDEPNHPLNAPFGHKGFEYRDEFFRVRGPYSRRRVRVLLSIDTARTDMNQDRARGNVSRADDDYALAWVRHYGRGRVFYCTIAHNPYVFWDPKMLQFYLGAAQFVLGDLAAPTIPSALATPAVRARERRGWRLALEAASGSTLFESIDRAAARGLAYVAGLDRQRISADAGATFDSSLDADWRRRIRLKLDAAGVRLLACRAGVLPADEAACRGAFAFWRAMGIEVIIAWPAPGSLEMLQRLCGQYDIRLALAGRPDGRRSGADPEAVLALQHELTGRVGICGDLPAWFGAGSDPIKGVRRLRDRLMVLRLDEYPDDHAARKGRVADGPAAQVLDEIQRLGLTPIFLVR